DSNPLSATEAETEKAGFIARPFDLLNGVSARYQLIAGNNGQLISTIVLHPIVCDEAALAVLRGDLIALAEGKELPVLPGDSLQRGVREEEALETPQFAAALAHWRDLIGEEYNATTLPTRFNAAGYA
ncbi:hypothetical protein NZA98_07870, partial [Escherichia coli]|nr:hypothetical protein [Escherichia coli]